MKNKIRAAAEPVCPAWQAVWQRSGACMAAESLFRSERHAVRALILRRVALVRSDGDAVQRAVVLRVAVIPAAGDVTFDTTIGFAAHSLRSPFAILMRESHRE